jgi:acetylornithine deacetylase
MHVDRPWITALLRDLVRIDSVNPDLAPGAPGEGAIAGRVSAALEELGLEVTRHEETPGRPSIVGRLPGAGRGRSLMLNAHYDTVGVDGMPEPFSGDVRDGRLYGRGAYDMKGSLAACIGAVKALVDAGRRPDGDVLIAAVADEEVASLGTAEIIAHHAVDGAIVTEPTSLRVCLAHKGFVWMEVRTMGRAAHGSRPELGIDANVRMGRVLAGLEDLERRLREREPHALLGHGSIHAATLRGGTGLSTYAAECVLGVERRTIPGEAAEVAIAEVRAILDRLSGADPTFVVTLEPTLAREPFEARPDSPLVDTVCRVMSDAGREPERVGDTPWMDAALLSAAGIDTMVLGPHGTGAHAAEEWVDLDSVMELADILAGTALAYCAG